MLVKYVFNKQEQWSSYLDTCVFAYNTSRHDSSKYTPFFLMFGRRATLPVDINFCEHSPAEKYQEYCALDDPELSTVFDDKQQILEQAKTNILQAQAKQKAQFDRKHAKPQYFQKDQQVLKKDFTRKKTRGGKLKDRYLGPYTITKVLPHGVYRLTDDTGVITRATGAHLKVYKKPLAEGRTLKYKLFVSRVKRAVLYMCS